MIEEKGNSAYDDMIHLPNPTSNKHPRMSLYDRAAQFSPFAALTGHEAAIKETARLTEEKKELDEDTIERLNEKLRIINENLDAKWNVTITYFLPDERKDGGRYVTCSGIVKRINVYEQTLIMMDCTVIPICQIMEIENRNQN